MTSAISALLFLSLQILAYASQPTAPLDVVLGIDGGTESIRACCFDAHNGRVVGKSHAVPYVTSHPNPGWAEQDPLQWYECLVGAVKGAVASLKDDDLCSSYNIKAMCCDTTCCSVVALSKDYTPLRPCLLWMDARSAPQAKRIIDVAAAASGSSVLQKFPELRVNSNGEGPISAEWLLPKAMWIKEMEPEIWEKAHVICEYQDYINYRLTNRMVASSCNAAVRWHHDGWDVLDKNRMKEDHAGRPTELYKALSISELANKLPESTLAMGDVVGGLSEAAAKDLALPEGTLVVQGGPDAFVGMIGLGTIQPNQLCLITGSSHLHCLVTPEPVSKSGMWGAYRGAPLPHLSFAEGGQSSTGRLLVWLRDLVSGNGEKETFSYKVLDEEASKITPGSDGLVALETWRVKQGSRTPYTDPLARGAFVGLSLSHTRAHMYRALLESVCFGTRACFDALESAARQRASTVATQKSNEVIIAGGATRSPLWLQLHADISGKTFLINENTDGPLLGCAVLASAGCGIYKSVDDAVKNMIRVKDKIEPNEERRNTYDRLYRDVYLKMRPSVTNIFHSLAEVRGGDTPFENRTPPRKVIVSPSILAADWSDMKGELEKCIDIGLNHIHVDVFDGVYLDSPHSFTFGPQMVQAISSRFPSLALDIHLCVDRPARFIDAMSESGAARIIFQWEAMGDDPFQPAVEFAVRTKRAGMKCGVSINPSTAVEEIFPLLETGLIDLVDVLAVEPGFGGQLFNPVALSKISRLRDWIDATIDTGMISILVDGGINKATSSDVMSRGADILVAGTALFRHPRGMIEALNDVLP